MRQMQFMKPLSISGLWIVQFLNYFILRIFQKKKHIFRNMGQNYCNSYDSITWVRHGRFKGFVPRWFIEMLSVTHLFQFTRLIHIGKHLTLKLRPCKFFRITGAPVFHIFNQSKWRAKQHCIARTYLQPHYGNGVFDNVYLSAGQH